MFVSKMPNQYLEESSVIIGVGCPHSNDKGIKLATELLQVFLNEKGVMYTLLGQASGGGSEFPRVICLLSDEIPETLGTSAKQLSSTVLLMHPQGDR